MIYYKHKSFRELSTSELYSIIQLRLEVFVLEQNCQYQDCDNKDLEAIHLMGFKEGQLVSYCRLLTEGISYPVNCAIGRVLTRSSARKLGLGKDLMNKAIQLCSELYESSIRISAQAYLENFYSNLGFKTITELYMEDGIPHVGMLYEFEKN